MASSAPAMSDNAPPSPTATDLTASPSPSSPLARHARQLGLFFAGAGFLAASVAITRRAVVRRKVASFPKYYMPNMYQPKFDAADRSALAASALGLATLNVMSFGVMLVGGVSWAFDLCSIQELSVRSQAAVRRPGLVDPEDERKLEELMDDLMSKMGMSKPDKSSGDERPEDPSSKATDE